MPGDESERGLRQSLASGWRALAAYLAAAVLYVAIGVAVPAFLFSWVVAAGYLVLCLAVLPALVSRFRS